MARRPFLSPSRVASRVPEPRQEPPTKPAEHAADAGRPTPDRTAAAATGREAETRIADARTTSRTTDDARATRDPDPRTTDAKATPDADAKATPTADDDRASIDLDRDALGVVGRSPLQPRTEPGDAPTSVDLDPTDLDAPEPYQAAPPPTADDPTEGVDGEPADPDLAEWQDRQAEVGEAHGEVQDAEDEVADAYEDLADAIRGLHLARVEGREMDVPIWEAQVNAYQNQLDYRLGDLEDAEEQLREAQDELRGWEEDHAELVVEQTGMTPEERGLEDELTELREAVRALELQEETSHGTDWAERVAYKQLALDQAHGQAQIDVGVAEGQLAVAQGEYATSLGKLSTWFAQQDEDFDLETYNPVTQLGNALEAAGEGDLDEFTAEWLADVQDDFDVPADLAAELAVNQLALQGAVQDLYDANVALAEAADQLDALDQITSVQREEDDELDDELRDARDALEQFEQEHADFVEAYDEARSDPQSDELEARYDFEQAALELEAAEEARIGAYEEVVEAEALLDQLRSSGADPEAIIRQEVALEVAVARLDRFDRLVEDASRDAGRAEDDLEHALEELAQDGVGDEMLQMDPGEALDADGVGLGDLTSGIDQATTPADEALTADEVAATPVADLEFGAGVEEAPAVADPVAAEVATADLAEAATVAEEVSIGDLAMDEGIAADLATGVPLATDAALATAFEGTGAALEEADAAEAAADLEVEVEQVAFDQGLGGDRLDTPFD